MSQQEFLDLKYSKHFTGSLVDSVFFGPGGSQWLENTVLYKKYAVLTDAISDVHRSNELRLYNRRQIGQKTCVHEKKKHTSNCAIINDSFIDETPISLTSDDDSTETEFITIKTQNDKKLSALMKQNDSQLAFDYGALSSTPVTSLSCHAPEFIPSRKQETQEPYEISANQHIFNPMYVEARVMTEFSETYRYYEGTQGLSSSNRMYQLEEDVCLKPFNISNNSNDSGIACENIHSPSCINKDQSRGLRKFSFECETRTENEVYDFTDNVDYDRCFPPLSRTRNTNITHLIGRTMEYENRDNERKSHYKGTSEISHYGKSQLGMRPFTSRRNDQTKRACVYCKRIGKNESMFDSHCLRNPITGKLMCPLLVENTCDFCGDTKDDQVHTTNDCKNRPQKQTGFMSFEPLLE